MDENIPTWTTYLTRLTSDLFVIFPQTSPAGIPAGSLPGSLRDPCRVWGGGLGGGLGGGRGGGLMNNSSDKGVSPPLKN